MTAGNDAGRTYDCLWAEAQQAFQNGRVEIDPHLDKKAKDRRLGLTVIGQPAPAVQARFNAFLDQARQVAPGQYFYRDGEFHLTVLSLFTATELFEPHWHNLAAYRAAVDQAMLAKQAFSVHYRGVTASKSAVMVQGFAQGPQLDHLRAALRQALSDAGFGGGLDQRYAINTAHATVMRFKSQPDNLPEILALLRENRTTDFGSTTFRQLLLVKNDWYMSQEKVRVLARYHLANGA